MNALSTTPYGPLVPHLGRSADETGRRRIGWWLALITVALGCYIILLPLSPAGYYDLNCGNAIEAAMSKPGPTGGPVPTHGELCHPLGTARLVDVGWIVGIGLLLSVVIGGFAQRRDT